MMMLIMIIRMNNDDDDDEEGKEGWHHWLWTVPERPYLQQNWLVSHGNALVADWLEH